MSSILERVGFFKKIPKCATHMEKFALILTALIFRISAHHKTPQIHAPVVE